MPTRPGWGVIVASIAAFFSARVFGLVELYVIGTALFLAAAFALFVVHTTRPRLVVTRSVHPSVLTVGTTGRVDLLITHKGQRRSPWVTVADPVGDHSTAFLSIRPLQRNEQVTAGYRLPATKRGVLLLGPAVIDHRDLLSLASIQTTVAAPTHVTVAPRTLDLPMPVLGHGPLGRHLQSLSQRVGPGEFHSLRDYVTGDEPRAIHWKASARSINLKVRNHESPGVQRCTVVLDNEHLAYEQSDVDAFERAVVVAGSLVVSADRAGLSTRLVTGGLDLRGPDVSSLTLQALASVQPAGPLGPVDRDPGEGLGLFILITASTNTSAWQNRSASTDPTATRIGVFTSGPVTGQFSIDATSLASFDRSWKQLASGQRIDQTRTAQHLDQSVIVG